MNLNNDITIVTAFFDIGRHKWTDTEFNRSINFYTESFLSYLDYDYKMICYVDDRYIDNIIINYNNSKFQNKIFIPINQQWLDNNIYAWQNINIEREILKSKEYKDILQLRLPLMYPNGIPEINRRNHLFPENEFAEYNVINHSKIDFIQHAISNKLINTTYTSWCDFGYFKSQHNCDKTTYPKNILDINKFTKNKMNFVLNNPIINEDYNMIYTLIIARVVFTGTFFCGPTNLMYKLQELYHECNNELHNNNISDDDQHVYLRCYIKNPELFELHINNDESVKGLVFFAIKN